MRAALVAIFVFAGLLALGHYVAAPFFCRGGIAVPGLDARLFCGADFHLSRAGSVLLYFMSIAVAVVFGTIVALASGGKGAAAKAGAESGRKEAAKPHETFEEIVAAEQKKEAKAAVAAPAAAEAENKSSGKAAKEIKSAIGETKPAVTPAAAKPETEKASPAKPAATPGDPLTAAIGDAITAGLAAKKGGAVKGFEGTNEELLERFRELKKQEGVNAVAQAQRLLDESTLSALNKGTDPKVHLSQIAHLVLAEDPDLKSGVVRGVVVHIAARLKELGVVNQKLPGAAKGAA
jgi:hypothetical protein